MKIEKLQELYTLHIAALLESGWSIDPFKEVQGATSAIVLKKDEACKVVYMICKPVSDYHCHQACYIGSGDAVEEWTDNSFRVKDLVDVSVRVFVEVRRNAGWYVSPDEYEEVVEKRQSRASAKYDSEMFRVWIGGKMEGPSEQAKKLARSAIRRVKGFGNTKVSDILRVYFESGRNGNWLKNPCLCVVVAGKANTADVPMPGYKNIYGNL